MGTGEREAEKEGEGDCGSRERNENCRSCLNEEVGCH